MNRASSQKLQQLRAWIQGIKIAMLTTEDRNGGLRSRPMVVLDDASDDALWFFAEASSHKIDDVHGHRYVNLSYADSAANRFVSVTGRARVLRERSRMRELWNRSLTEWFPKGVDDPELVLLRIEVHEAELWQSPVRQVDVEFAITSSPSSSHEMMTFA